MIACDFFHWRTEVIIRRIDAVFLLGGFGAHHAAYGKKIAKPAADRCIIRKIFRNDVKCALKGVLSRFHALFRVKEI